MKNDPIILTNKKWLYKSDRGEFYRSHDDLFKFRERYRKWRVLDKVPESASDYAKLVHYCTAFPEYECWTTLQYIKAGDLVKGDRYFVFPTYSISSKGRVWSHGRREIKFGVNRNGYYRVMIRANGRIICVSKHRALMASFYPEYRNDEGLGPDVLQINHMDSDPKNNCITNLEWCTCQENSRHRSIANGDSRPIKITLIENLLGYKKGEFFIAPTSHFLMDKGLDPGSFQRVISDGRPLYRCHWSYTEEDGPLPPDDLLEEFKRISDDYKSKPVKFTLLRPILSYSAGKTFYIPERAKAEDYGMSPSSITSSIFSGKSYFGMCCEDFEYNGNIEILPSDLGELFKSLTEQNKFKTRVVGIEITLLKDMCGFKQDSVFRSLLKNIARNKPESGRIRTPARRGYALEGIKIKIIEEDEVSKEDFIPEVLVRILRGK